MKASDLFVQCLENEGVTKVFGVPGEENLDLLESLRTSKIEVIVTRNEQTAVFMAATYGRLTWHPGVAIATLGPGATNMVTGVAHAQLGWMPIIVVTGQKPIKQSKQGHFQVLDLVNMMAPLTKWSTSVVDIHRIPATVRQAFKLAESERPGAVHIEFAEDIARETSDQSLSPLDVEKIRRPQIDEKCLEELVRRIKKAKRPIILIGAGANRKRVSDYLTKFIEKTNMPFFTSQMGKWVVSEFLPQCLWTAALTSGDYIHEAIEKADCILAVWYDVIEKPTNVFDEKTMDLIHINFYAADVDQLYSPNLEVIGDIGNTFWQLYETELKADLRDFSEIYKIQEQIKSKIIKTTDEEYDQKILWPRRLAKHLRELLEPEDILALDNGLYKVWIARNFPSIKPNTLLLDNALATMGAWYSIALTAKMLNPSKRVVCVVGDGGLLMNLGDLETVASSWLDMTIIILNDNAYGMIKRKQHHMWFKDYSLDLKNPNFGKLAEAFGAQYMKVEIADLFAETVDKAMRNKGLTIVEVAFAYPPDIT